MRAFRNGVLVPTEVTVSSPGSVTCWIAQLRAGDQEAAQRLWEHFFGRLVARARRRLAGLPRRAADEEDVALSAFDSFCRAAQQGRFPRLDDRDDLWQVLVLITERKVSDLAQLERRQKRDSRRVLDEAALPQAEAARGPTSLTDILSREPDPRVATQMAEEWRRLLDLLEDADLREVAVRKMEGYTVEEIAGPLGWVPRTVKRKLRLIRQIWAQELRG
jgi:DNA-directed RNA polymerase specialized sigma24 family protein